MDDEKQMFFPIPWNHSIFQWQIVKGGAKSINIGIAVILVFVFCLETFFPHIAGMLFF